MCSWVTLVCHCHPGGVKKGLHPHTDQRFEMSVMASTLLFSRLYFLFAIALGLLPEEGKCFAEVTWGVDNLFLNSANKMGKVSRDPVL